MKRLIKKALNVDSVTISWTNLTKTWEDAGPEGYEAGKSTWTACQEGDVTLDSISNIPGANNENRTWWEWNGTKRFGNYSEEDWNEFLEDIKTNGIKYPIMIWVEKDLSIVLAEGNHRREAAKQLGLSSIPVEIRYYGNSQRESQIWIDNNMQGK